MLAYHGRTELKDAVLTIMAEHEAADRIVQGAYKRLNGKGEFAGGCAVGCTLESLRRIEGLADIQHDDHQLYERYLGVPVQLAWIEDKIFESLPRSDARTWPTRFARAIRPGADLSLVWPKWLRALLADPSGGVQAGAAKRPEVQPSIDAVIALFDEWIATGSKPERARWHGAAYAADAAAYAAYAAAAYAAYAAADDDDARSQARAREVQRQAYTLIALLEAA